MLITGANAIIAGHALEIPDAVNYNRGSPQIGSEFRRRKLIDFNCVHDTINPAAALLANIHASHHVG